MPDTSEPYAAPVAVPGRVDDAGTQVGWTAPRDAAPGDERLDVLFRQAMSRLAAGVVIVTCRVDERPWGVTATACCPISVAPALILVSLSAGTVSASAIERSGRFGVSLLGSRALDAARFASRPGRPKFLDDYCEPEQPTGAYPTPMVGHAVAHVDCMVDQLHRVADHLLFVGAVQAVRMNGLDRPLVYCSRRYHGLDEVGDGERPR